MYDWRCPGCDTPEHEAEQISDYEIVVVREGSFVREVDGAPSFAHEGVLTLAAPGEEHRIRHPAPGGDACTVFRASEDTMREILAERDPGAADAMRPLVPPTQVPLGGRETLLHRLAFAAARRGTEPVETEESALWFVHAALGRAFAPGSSGPRVPAMTPRTARAWAAAVEYTARVLHVVSTRYHEKLSLARIGRAVHCSPFHVSRLVTSVTGVPIHRLLVRHRLRRALDRVLDSEGSLSEIAFATGFSSHSHLTDTFRRELGVAPQQVRRLPGRAVRTLVARAAEQPTRRARSLPT